MCRIAEAALWCLLNSRSCESSVLEAGNLQDHTSDTVAPISGGLVGLFYEVEGISASRIEQAAGRSDMDALPGACRSKLSENHPYTNPKNFQ